MSHKNKKNKNKVEAPILQDAAKIEPIVAAEKTKKAKSGKHK